ncbi:MAG: NAD-dependent epimerase/dehydratase family protein [Candidatus Wenzhouxiangella sp. M2_3B_020]
MSNLVTGGAGFIGTHLVRWLRDRGEDVRVLDLRRPVEPVPGTEYLEGSITDRALVGRAADGCRRVYHMAAHSGLWTGRKQDFLDVNVIGTRNVLDAARAAGVETVVHTSSETVLVAAGRGRGEQRVDEDVNLQPGDMAGAYCVGKLLAEREAWRAWREHGQKVVICNPTVPVGPGDPWQTPPTRMLLGFLQQRYRAYLPTVLNLVDARDVALGHWLAAEKARPGTRLVLGAHDVALGELLQGLEALSGIRMPRWRVPYPAAWLAAAVGEWLADHVTRRPPAAPLIGVRLAGIPVSFDNRRTRELLDWRPRPLDESLSDALTDFAERGLIDGRGRSLQQPNRAR